MEILRALGESERSVSEVVHGLEVVSTLLANIADSPSEDRFRRVRKGNARIAALLGREEEGLLRAAGFEDDEDDYLICLGGLDVAPEPAAPSQLSELLGAVRAASGALQAHLPEDNCATSEAAPAACAELGLPGLLCRDPPVARALDCALLDYVGQRSIEAAESHKRRRRADEAEALSSSERWREALDRAGGGFLRDGGPLEAWLDAAAAHRHLAHELVVLQEAAMRWYGPGARQHCESWRAGLLARNGVRADAGAGAALPGTAISGELQALREAIFEFPEWEGAAPALFRKASSVAGDGADGSGDCTVTTVCRGGRDRGAAELVPLE